MSRQRKPVPDALADWSPRRIATFFAKFDRAVAREQREEPPERRYAYNAGPDYIARGYRVAMDPRYRTPRTKKGPPEEPQSVSPSVR